MVFVHNVLMNFHLLLLNCSELAEGTIKFAFRSCVSLLHVAVYFSYGLGFELTEFTWHNIIEVNLNMFLQISNVRCCIAAVFLRTRVFYPTMNAPFMLLKLTFVFEHLVTMFTKVNDHIVLLEHMIL